LNFIDTALAYGEGRSERLVGEVVRKRPEAIIVATKVPPKNLTWPARDDAHVEDVFPADHVLECAGAVWRTCASTPSPCSSCTSGTTPGPTRATGAAPARLAS
jgi:Aldo/keto reductase family